MALGRANWTPHEDTNVIVWDTAFDAESIVGGASLRVTHRGTDSEAAQFWGGNVHLPEDFVVPLRPNVKPRGFLKGSLRTLIRMDVKPPDEVPNTHAGLICMQTAVDMSGEMGSAYLFGWGVPKNPPFDYPKLNFLIFKLFGVGLSGSSDSYIELAGSGSFDVDAGDMYPIEFRWDFNLQKYGGIRLTGLVGTKNAETYTGMSVVCDTLDSSPLAYSAGEGFYSRHGIDTFDPGFPDDMVVTFDETYVRELD